MKEHYTCKGAIELLGFTSINAFLQLVRKYPDAFVNVNPKRDKDKYPWYDKATLDQFAQLRERFKQENA